MKIIVRKFKWVSAYLLPFVFSQSFADVVLVHPDDARAIPEAIAEQLFPGECQVPVKIEDVDVDYYLQGEFARRGQVDHAVNCRKGREAYIRIFWGGATRCHSIIKNTRGDSISKVGKKFIMSRYEAYGGPVPPEITHDAVNDEILEKASVVFYCYNGEWLTLTGSD